MATMVRKGAIFGLLLYSATTAIATPVTFSRSTNTPNITVDLGYALYEGYHNSTTNLNIWKGIRYAAPPVADLRWKAPKTPQTSRNGTLPATAFGPKCPQAYPDTPNVPFTPGNEDCLFLNVFSPAGQENGSVYEEGRGKEGLPVLVWIHGGGYGLGDGTQDLSTIIGANGGSFVGVAIQYRLGAFGFLSSSEVKKDGVPNAGILDMAFALEWVQKHISKFGGDPKNVTISGESAGGGAVMLLGIAKSGDLKTSLFKSGIAASPYLPPQYDYNATIPTQRYNDFASKAGCAIQGDVLQCLRSKDSNTLQTANANVTSGVYGTWAFLPVTDYSFIASLPSVALEEKRVNGENILVGNNANEGPLFVPPAIKTLDDLKAWLQLSFPTFNDTDVQAVLNAYPSTDGPVNPNATKFATDGIGPATAVNISQVATGQQQRANNIYAEVTFVCPSYWINSAYSPKSYHYQYSVPFGSHGDDVAAYFGPSVPNQSPDFTSAFRHFFGNFITKSTPAISSDPVLKDWPTWSGGEQAKMVNLNETGGTPYQAVSSVGINVTQFEEPGLLNAFSVADAYTWEGGRGKRCDFWKSVAKKISI